MATFSVRSVDNIGDTKVRDYLYRLNEDLTYMFNNLTPEDNYSEYAQFSYAKIVYNDQIVAEINASEEGLMIIADRISLEGLVTVNGYFKVLEDGSIEATNGKFSGTITASHISSSTIDVGRLYADDEKVMLGCFYAYTSDISGAEYLATNDQTVGMGDHPSYAFWAGHDSDNPAFMVNRDGNVFANEFFYVSRSGVMRSLSSIINELWEAIDSMGDDSEE